jgi:predicted amidohydrolase YtcJ
VHGPADDDGRLRYVRSRRVFTGRSETGFASAFAVRRGAVEWVGDGDDVPAGADVLDLGDAVVLPGLIDTHTHPTYIAMTLGAVACTPPEVTSIPSLVAALRRHAGDAAAADDRGWIRGWGYDEIALVERRPPTRHDLDRVSTTRPVHVLRSDCHSGVCNTRALELAGIGRDTADPPGARFGREADGTPDGVLVEHAANHAVLAAMGPARFDDEVDRMVATSAHLSARGIVACTDMLCVPTPSYSQLELYRAAVARGFRQQVRVFYDFASIAERPVPIEPIESDEARIAVGGVKVFVDGSVSNRTAWMREPYRAGDHGMRTATPDLMVAALELARRHGVQLAVHAMGDRAIEATLDAYGDETPWLADRPSVRLEHATVLDDALIGRIASAPVGIGVATNIDFLFAEYDAYAEHFTADQLRRSYPVRALYDRVDALALSSDCPATTWADPDDPFVSIHAAVNRRAHHGADLGADQAITAAQAVLLYTGRARRVTPMPGVGTIAPGSEASFVAISDDVFAVDPASIADVQVTATWIAGEQVFSR